MRCCLFFVSFDNFARQALERPKLMGTRLVGDKSCPGPNPWATSTNHTPPSPWWRDEPYMQDEPRLALWWTDPPTDGCISFARGESKQQQDSEKEIPFLASGTSQEVQPLPEKRSRMTPENRWQQWISAPSGILGGLGWQFIRMGTSYSFWISETLSNDVITPETPQT